MLSASQRYASSFGNATMHSHSHSHHRMSTSGLDTLAESSQYALQQLQHEQAMKASKSHRESYPDASPDDADDHGDGSASNKNAKSSGQPVRRRISRACDQCNQLRTKCDGKSPCAHCVEFGLTCEYARERKKRGKASRKDIAAQQAAAEALTTGGSTTKGPEDTPKSGTDNSAEEVRVTKKRRRSSNNLPPPSLPPPRAHAARPPSQSQPRLLPSMEHHEDIQPPPQPNILAEANGHERPPQHHSMTLEQQTQVPGSMMPNRLPSVGMPDRGMSVGIGEYVSIDDYHRSILHPGTVNGHNILHSSTTGMPNSVLQGNNMTGYGESPYAVPSPGSQQGLGFRIGGSPMSATFLGQSAGSPGWLSLPSPTAAMYLQNQPISTGQPLRYPVLRPLLPHISAIIPIPLACDLLELYFSSTSSTFMQPQSPYIVGYVFRKRSILRQQNHRNCSPALLASMLWIAAQTSESAFLTSPPSARGKICQKLLELTVGLLKPLVHSAHESPAQYGNSVINGVALGGFGVALPHRAQEETGNPGAYTACVDDVATYVHLATVVSASEYKAASLRWWNAAWSLARELKLGREAPQHPEPQNVDTTEGAADHTGESISGHSNGHGQSGFLTEEEREERRRAWWLLYMMDRHLALCYNRPLFLLDVECDGLLQPVDEKIWQAGEYYPSEMHSESIYFRQRGPSFECAGHSIFGYFLPVMTILGEIVELNQARNHPRFGTRFKDGNRWDDQAAEITQQLEAYGRSLKEFEARNNATHVAHDTNNTNGELTHNDKTSPSAQSAGTSSSQRMTEAVLQTKIVVAYGTHLMHTLHILLNGKWDPISLLDDNDLWISSQSFISATGHAVSAAEAINEILDYDPDLSFMPYFFGIYLLQGSFLLLLIADKLQGEASPSVVKACETIVRAHEACVVTLNTEYQRNFRKVMRSALNQVRGRMVEDFGEQQLKRREMLALYRWTGDGTGLAL